MEIEEQHQDTTRERFVKVDFHIHTPQSKCYGDLHVTADQIVDTALNTGLAAIAITDHNTASGIDAIREAGHRKGLAVFPGIELSTRSGHVLALFDRETPISRLDAFLDDAGSGLSARGDGAAFIHDSLEDALRKIEEHGGIGVAAHIERWPTGFLQTRESRRTKARIHSSQYLRALEITQPQNKGLWNSGTMRGYPKKYACIQGSDAHALDEIGRRPTLIKLTALNLQGLRHAFNDCENSIRFPEEMPERG